MSVWSNFSCSSCQPGSAKGPSIQTLAAAQSSATGNDVQKAALAKLFCRAFLLFPRVLPFLKALLPFPRALPFPRHCLFSRHMHSSVLHFLEAFCTFFIAKAASKSVSFQLARINFLPFLGSFQSLLPCIVTCFLHILDHFDHFQNSLGCSLLLLSPGHSAPLHLPLLQRNC